LHESSAQVGDVPDSPSGVRDRFLSEFALTLAEGARLPDLLERAVKEICRLVDVDRVTLFLRDTPEDGDLFTLKAAYSKDGVPQFPVRHARLAFLSMYPALESGKSLVAGDVESDGDLARGRELFGELGTRSLAMLPIKTHGTLRGFVSVAVLGGTRAFTPADVSFLESAVRHLSAAVQQMELVEELAKERDRLRQHLEEANALAAVTRSLLTRTAKRDVLLQQILQALVAQLPTDNCSIILLDRERKHLVETAQHGPWPHPTDRFLRADGPGLIAWSVRNRALVNCPHVGEDTRYLPGWQDCRSELVVPLVLDGHVIGAFDVESARPGAFTEAHERMLTAFAERAVLALHVSELVGELEERTRALEGVARATKLLNFRLHAPDVLSSFVEETSRAFPSCDGCVAYVADEEGKTLRIAAAYGLGKTTLAGHGLEPTPVEELRCAGRALRENRTVLLDVSGIDELIGHTTPEERARVKTSVADPDFRQLLAAPIRVGDRRLGVIEVLSRRPGAFSPADQEVLVLLAEQAAIALRNARLIEELQRSSRLKDDFLANLSHEVRTPLTGVIGWAEVLLDARGDDPQTKRATTAILGQAESLQRMLSDLIDLSKIDHHGLDMRRAEVRLEEVVASALDAVSPGAGKRGVAVKAELAPGLPTLDGDAGRLKQVVWNLLANAVKFSPPGSEVALEARRLEGGGVEVVVSDRGYGIDAAFLPHVFDRFRQEETATNRRFGGLGVGLSIARAIVLAHGGSIEGESAGRGHGARFTVRLPAPSKTSRSSGAFAAFRGETRSPAGPPPPP
jgi:signal transduction histidine kinase